MTWRNRVLELRQVRAAELKQNPRNFRRHPERQSKALRGVLEEVGIAGALLAYNHPERGLELIDGHLRQEQGGVWPVLVLDVTENEANILLATHDPIGMMAEQDAQVLRDLVAGLDVKNAELAAMLEELSPEPPAALGDPEAIPDVTAQAVSQTGDLWLLGKHRVLCGDSTRAEDVERLMNGEKADLCFTSPPYGQQRDYTEESKDKLSNWDALMRGVFGNLPMSKGGQVLVNLGMIHRDNEWLPYWDSWIEWMRSQGWMRFGWYVWDQGPGLPGDWNGRFAPSHEFVFHFNKQSLRPKKTKDCKWAGTKNVGKGLRGADNKVKDYSHAGIAVQQKKIPDSVIRVSRHKSRGIEVSHPAVFSVLFACEFLLAWPGTAYEPFCGSGTTLIAAEQLGRECYAMEISPKYVDVIVKRWQTFTGHQATLEATGETFAQVEVSRG